MVAPGGVVAGFIAELDIVGALDRNGTKVTGLRVGDVMRRPAPSCGADDSLQDVMTRITRESFRHLAVIDGGRLAGVISVGDLVKHRREQLETETGVLRDYVAAQRTTR